MTISLFIPYIYVNFLPFMLFALKYVFLNHLFRCFLNKFVHYVLLKFISFFISVLFISSDFFDILLLEEILIK